MGVGDSDPASRSPSAAPWSLCLRSLWTVEGPQRAWEIGESGMLWYHSNLTFRVSKAIQRLKN